MRYNIDELNSFGCNLLYFMRISGYTQEKLSSILGVSQASLSYYIKGKRGVNSYTLYRLTRIFGIFPSQLIKESLLKRQYLKEITSVMLCEVRMSLCLDQTVFLSQIGLFFNEQREKAQITQEIVANFIGKDRSLISKFEKGIVDLPFSTLLKLCDFFDVSIDHVFPKDLSTTESRIVLFNNLGSPHVPS